MINNKNITIKVLVLCLGFLLSNSFFAQTPTAKKKKEPRHFFSTTGLLDYYNKPQVDLNLKDSNKVSKHLI